MPQSKNRKNHKTQVNKFKNKIKQQMSEAQNAAQQQIPPVRSVPVWANDAVIKMSGLEFEAMYNTLMQMQLAQQAANSIMSKNILDGTIQMDFEKLSDDKQSYVPMTDEEKAPHVEQFAMALEAARRPQSQIIQPETGLVDANGDAVGSEPKAKKAPKAKVVKGNFSGASSPAQQAEVPNDGAADLTPTE